MGQVRACGTCRFWDGAGAECRRHPPVVVSVTSSGVALAGAGHWPHTAATDWCGEWQTGADTPPPPAAIPTIGDLAARRFVRRLAPALRTTDPAGVLAPLLGQLPPDVRHVIVRLHGLDGTVADDVKRVAAETGQTAQRVRGLRSAGEYLLRDAFVLLTDRQTARDGGRSPLAELNGTAPPG